MIRLTQELKDTWIAALRSGKYSQTIGKLHQASSGYNKHVGYCCLGVLCDVAKIPVEKNRFCGADIYIFGDGIMNSDLTVPREFVPEPHRGILMNMNDRGSTFTEIAQYIEDNVPTEELTENDDR